jgi:hypothetical protein
MTNKNDKKLKDMLDRYLSGDDSIRGVAILVDEEETRIAVLMLNSSGIEAFLLMLHGLQTLHDKAVSNTAFNKTVH